MRGKVLIIGGGFAGLAAGVTLAQAGREVHLVEQKPYLGGRARSFHYSPMNMVVDNGQHIFMGCYHSTIEFLRSLGTLDRVRFQPSLKVHFCGKEDGLTSLALPHLPAPWHLMAGTLLSGSFSWREKFQIVRLGRVMRASHSGGQAQSFARLTVDEWLARLGQSEKLRRNFWDLLCIAALNEDPHIAPARLFEPVLRLALLQSPEDSRIGLARAGLSECYTDAASAFIRHYRGEVALARDVTGILIRHNENGITCEGVRLADGSAIEAEAVLSTVTPPQLIRILSDARSDLPKVFRQIETLRPAPIISINLWFDRAITDLDFVGLRGTTVQWIFNKGRLLGSPYLSLVISGAHKHIDKDKSALLGLALAELKELFPAARGARLIHSLIMKERNATFSPPADSPEERPGAAMPVAGLYLAGDWTETGLPSTIESAVKSGYTAASEILKAF
jgi:hydroxysqualene dehydroxylase